jgi:glycerol uptake facilitator protein
MTDRDVVRTAREPAELAEEVQPEPKLSSALTGELLGGFIIILIGDGVVAIGTLTKTGVGDLFSAGFGWALAVALAIYCGATLSGAHFNPAVTLALAATGRHPWRRVAPYIGAQITGMLLGAAALALFWWPTMRAFARDNGLTVGQAGSEKLAAIFSPYSPHPGFMDVDKFPIQIGFWQGFAVEFFATGILLIVILSLLESRSVNSPSAWFFPLVVGLTVGVLVFTTAPLTMTSLNPARDLGPRIMLFFLGFGKIAFPGLHQGLSTLVTVIGPITGGVAGALFFDHVLLRRYPKPEREKGPVTEPSQLAEERGDGIRVSHGHAVRG